ncbi:hypothetical protein AUJ10_01335 [Candidatus Pacearchaeota archaeon CG1_02_31_27]|nr:MAG: hypothetical protein AUJ10_01335 [Candidatus Pacearchaeota archaeon CG1_02_31_27]PIN92019.1 MAG: hypothetical protein COU55_03075 [Candidatus Pacearchaeota archaeon CG10_big_fil_rev_8_21_14_0_10_31_59]PIZ81103.1 MAG: hypothetical protein COX99_00690 [Candidatus Pacearchaeota archaeon CG_4_10_14_0_2_um_filter_31_10]
MRKNLKEKARKGIKTPYKIAFAVIGVLFVLALVFAFSDIATKRNEGMTTGNAITGNSFFSDIRDMILTYKPNPDLKVGTSDTAGTVTGKTETGCIGSYCLDKLNNKCTRTLLGKTTEVGYGSKEYHCCLGCNEELEQEIYWALTSRGGGESGHDPKCIRVHERWCPSNKGISDSRIETVDMHYCF